MAVGVDRRSVLAGLGAGALGSLVLAACGDDAPTTEAGTPGPQNALIASFPQTEPHIAAGVPMRLPYLISDPEGVPLSEIDGPVRFTVASDGRPVGKPVEVDPHGDGVPRAYLPLSFTFPGPGYYDITAEYGGGELDSTVQVYAAEDITAPLVGEPLPPVDTPTDEQAFAVDPICTAVPQCPFHAVNLRDALTMGKPVVVLLATPAYCQTAVCGPILDLLIDEIGDRDDLTVIHAEVYKNAKEVAALSEASLAPLPEQYGMLFEPALFVTDAAGMLVARGDVVVDRVEMAEMIALAE